MIHIKMEYMYRDTGNNKLRSNAIFRNEHQLTISQLIDFIEVAFIDGGHWFDPVRCGIPKLSFERFDEELDHSWHEVELICITDEPATQEMDISDFLLHALKVHQCWKYDLEKWAEYNFHDETYS